MFLDVSTLKVGDRVVRVNRRNGEWHERRGWNEIPARVTAVYPTVGAFRVECFHPKNTYNCEIVPRDFGIQWPEGHHKAKPFAHTGLWARVALDYKQWKGWKVAGYERLV